MAKAKSPKEKPVANPEEVYEQRQRDFLAKYEQLIKDTGMKLAVIPNYKARDDGSWSTVLATHIIEAK